MQPASHPAFFPHQRKKAILTDGLFALVQKKRSDATLARLIQTTLAYPS